MFQTFNQPLVHKLIEEIHLFRRIFQNIIDDIFQHGFGQGHIVIQVRKGHLRLDHPELCRMTGRVGIFCTEGWTKGINIPESHRKGLSVQLSADGQIRFFTKEILRIIHMTFLILRHIFRVQCRHTEHLTGSFTVTSGNQWRMHINKIPFLEKFMDCIGNQGAYTEHRLEGIRPCPQMGHGPQIFKAVTFRLNRIIRRGSTFHINTVRLNLKRLFCLRCRD